MFLGGKVMSVIANGSNNSIPMACCGPRFSPMKQSGPAQCDSPSREVDHVSKCPIHLLQKILHPMNLQLDQIISDGMGTTGLQILRAMVAGERDPAVLARFWNPRCKQPWM